MRAWSRVAAAPLLLGATSCVLLPTLGGPPPRDGAPPPAGGGLEDLRGIVHCHSSLSHDSRGEPEDIAAAAREAGARFVILTDHLRRPTQDQGPDGLLDGVLFLPGFEARSDGGGSLLGLGARVGVDPQAGDAAVMARVRLLGGLVLLGHLEERRRRDAPVDADAVELMNLHADTTDECEASLGARALALPPGAFLRSLVDRQARAAVVYEVASRRGHPVAAVGACDAHEAVRLLGPLGGAVDSYRRVFRAATTHVLAPALTRDAVLAALAAGRSYAACELDADATGTRVFVRRGASRLAELGGTAPLGPGLELVAELPRSARITLLRDGAPLMRRDARGLTVALVRPGLYRVEAALDGAPWVTTSAIRITARE